MGDNRWFKLWSLPEDHWLNEDLRFIGGWYDLIGMAEWKDRKIIRQGSMIEAKRGTIYTSIHELAERWHVSRKWVRHFVEMLVADGMVTELQRDHRGYHLKVNNYAKYQDNPNHRGTTKDTTEGTTEDTTEGTTEGTTKATSYLISEEGKEYKEDTERESKRETARFTPPTLSEVLAYISEKRYAVDGRRFWEYYESIGWKVGRNRMKDWKAAVRSWNAKDEQDRKQRQAPSPGRFNNFEAREPGASLMDEYIKLLEA